jgi:hypothetical protein
MATMTINRMILIFLSILFWYSLFQEILYEIIKIQKKI